MSRDFEESSSMRAEFASHGDFTTKVSISFWLKAESNPGAHQAIFVSKTRQGFDRPNFSLLWTPAGGGDVYTVAYAGGSFNEWKADYSPTLAAWEHWYFELDWTTNPDTHLFWVNGVAKTMTHNFGSNNVTPDVTATQVYSIGGPGASTNFADGLLAEIAVWSDLVGITRATTLYNNGRGARASDVYPANLVEYIRFKGDDLTNVKGGTGTLTNAPTRSLDHPFQDPDFMSFMPFR